MENVIAQVKAVLSTTASYWKTLTETLPADVLTRRPAPKEWSAGVHIVFRVLFAFGVKRA